MKIKEYFKIFKNLLISKNLIILRCPYCDSLDIKYFKDTLTEKDIKINSIDNYKEIQYKVACKRCGGLAIIGEHWRK